MREIASPGTKNTNGPIEKTPWVIHRLTEKRSGLRRISTLFSQVLKANTKKGFYQFWICFSDQEKKAFD